MGWFTGTVLYVLIWWTVLFAVLPLWTKPSADPDPATGWRGAPDSARMGRKLLVTTLISLLIWCAVAAVIESGVISFRHGPLALPDQ